MVAVASNTSETSPWNILNGFPKLHSRAREAKTRHCTEATACKSLNCVEIWQVIYDYRIRLESFSRDPIEYNAGVNQYQLMSSNVLVGMDPNGLFEVSRSVDGYDGNDRCEIVDHTYREWYVKYFNQFGGIAPRSASGCIGVVKDYCGLDDFNGPDTECFHFPGDVDRTYAAANEAFKNKQCPCESSPMIFAYNSFKGAAGVPSCPKCGKLSLDFRQPFYNYGDPIPEVPFDYCVRLPDGKWSGVTRGVPTGKVRIWPNLKTFAKHYGSSYYNTVIMCITCSGASYKGHNGSGPGNPLPMGPIW